MFVRAAAILTAISACLGAAETPSNARLGPLLLADDTRVPQVRVAWTRADGSRAEYETELVYGSPEDRESLGENLQAFVGLGGSRLEKGAGHPEGAIVRVGLFKSDRERLFFAENGVQPIAPLFVQGDYLLVHPWLVFQPAHFGGEQFDTYMLNPVEKRLERQQ